MDDWITYWCNLAVVYPYSMSMLTKCAKLSRSQCWDLQKELFCATSAVMMPALAASDGLALF